MKKISRYILVLITIISTMVVLPGLYWLAFETPTHSPYLFYSCINNGFVVQRYKAGKRSYSDLKGHRYASRSEFEQKLPLLYIRQLLVSGKMPDSIHGVEINIHKVNRNRSFFRLRPKDISAPQPGLYPMFESQSGRINLEMPKDFFRIKSRMEFINAKTNKVEEAKSNLFTSALQRYGFAFPSKMIAGIPTTRKSCDEGYFVVDAHNELFHVKMVRARPYVKKIKLPEGLKFQYIACVDFSDKKYYNYLISDKNEIYILTQDDYKIIKFPVNGYNPKREELRIFGDLFNYSVYMVGKDHLKIVVLNKQYQKVDEYQESWPNRSQRIEGKVFSYIFPAQLSLSKWYSNFNKFYFERTGGFHWIFLNILLIIIYFFILRKRKIKPKKGIIDFILIAITGIFGFIGVLCFPNKFYD